MSENISTISGRYRERHRKGRVRARVTSGRDATRHALRRIRTPIREALMQLSAIGLVEIRPRRGAVSWIRPRSGVYEMC